MLHRALGLYLLLSTAAFADCYTDALDRITNVTVLKFSYTNVEIKNQDIPSAACACAPAPRYHEPKPRAVLEVMIVSERWTIWRLMKGP